MGYAVFLKMNEATHAWFEHIRTQLNLGTEQSQAKALGNVLSEIACEIIEQVFVELLQKQKQKNDDHAQKHAADSEKVIHQILETMRKYLPWSVSFFSNERLIPLVNYLAGLLTERDRQIYVRYALDPVLVQEAFAQIEKVRDGQMSYVPRAFQALTKIVDEGVTSLIRKPKQLLKFNLVVDKTLNGVIHMTTHLGYKRLEKLGEKIDSDTANEYIEHFLYFMQKEA
ncbi:hypothetical protein [Acinetobacter ihumii]|uniref:hypothetical protein n=1 Tax=Acinetobacter ihumii TaxID=2483802 RepID=UPI00102F84B0|nr:hypothetical protein [Acinetobacter ihumii]